METLRQAFMSSEEYEGLCEEERVWRRLQRPLCMAGVTAVWTAVVVATMNMVDVVFAVSGDGFSFCQQQQGYGVVGDTGDLPSYVYTKEEAVDAFWLVVFLSLSIVFIFSAFYLVAGISVAYSAPERYNCLMVVENDCCAPGRAKIPNRLQTQSYWRYCRIHPKPGCHDRALLRINWSGPTG